MVTKYEITFLDNSKYDHWILHKKLVIDESCTIIHISTHISLNIGPRILNFHTPEYPFPWLVTNIKIRYIYPKLMLLAVCLG